MKTSSLPWLLSNRYVSKEIMSSYFYILSTFIDSLVDLQKAYIVTVCSFVLIVVRMTVDSCYVSCQHVLIPTWNIPTNVTNRRYVQRQECQLEWIYTCKLRSDPESLWKILCDRVKVISLWLKLGLRSWLWSLAKGEEGPETTVREVIQTHLKLLEDTMKTISFHYKLHH